MSKAGVDANCACYGSVDAGSTLSTLRGNVESESNGLCMAAGNGRTSNALLTV